jgi:hypothetical protein
MKTGYSVPGVVVKIDKDFYGASQAYKVYNAKRGEGLHPKMVNGIGPTRDGIQDRIMIAWPDHGFTYEESSKLEVIT